MQENPNPVDKPRTDERMTAEELERFNEWFEEHARMQGRAKCVVCGSEAWNLEPMLGQMSGFKRGKPIFGGPVYPFVLLTCVKCSNTLFINAIQAGVVKRPKQENSQSGGGNNG